MPREIDLVLHGEFQERGKQIVYIASNAIDQKEGRHEEHECMQEGAQEGAQESVHDQTGLRGQARRAETWLANPQGKAGTKPTWFASRRGRDRKGNENRDETKKKEEQTQHHFCDAGNINHENQQATTIGLHLVSPNALFFGVRCH